MNRRTVFWIGVGGFGFVVLVLAANTCVRALGVAARVTPATIRAVKPGMTKQEVEAILGVPLQDRAWGRTGTILTYARSHPFAFWSGAFWIYLEDDHVQTVSAQRVPLLGWKRTVYHTGAGELPPYGTLPALETDEFEATFGPCRGLSAIWESIKLL